MTVNYTKSEWKLHGLTIETHYPPNGHVIATMNNIGNRVQADAHLIAAAPDMYEALRLLVGRFANMEKKYTYPMALDLPRVWAEKALAKAEGK